MFNLKLIPRLNYDYSISDALFAFKSFINDNLNYQPLYHLFNNENIYFTNHARTGLRLLLNSFGLPKGSRIGVQPFNCHTVLQAVLNAGHVPVYIDINERFTIDTDDLEKKISKVDLLIITHTFGVPADLDEIIKITQEKPIIEDCAHSFLSKYKEKLTGTFGDASIFSFGHAKFPAISKGGFVIINNKNLISEFTSLYKELPSISKLSELKNIFYNFLISLAHKKPIYGLLSFPIGKRIDNEFDFASKYSFSEYKASNSDIALFFKKFKYLNNFKIKQKHNAENIQKKILINYNFIEEGKYVEFNYFMIPLIIDIDRTEFINKVLKNGIEIGAHFSDSKTWVNSYGYNKGDCPYYEKNIDNIITLPCHYNYPESGLKRLIQIIQNENCN